MSAPISLRAYARDRASRGLPGNAMAVSLAIKAGRLVKSVTYVDGQPKIADSRLADEEWERNTDHQRRANAAGGIDLERARLSTAQVENVQRAAGAFVPALPEVEVLDPEDSGKEPESVATATERLKSAQADLAEIKRDEARGLLIPAREVEKRMIEVFAACRTKLLAIPSRSKQQLPHLSASDVVQLETLVREALEELAEAPT